MLCEDDNLGQHQHNTLAGTKQCQCCLADLASCQPVMLAGCLALGLSRSLLALLLQLCAGLVTAVAVRACASHRSLSLSLSLGHTKVKSADARCAASAIAGTQTGCLCERPPLCSWPPARASVRPCLAYIRARAHTHTHWGPLEGSTRPSRRAIALAGFKTTPRSRSLPRVPHELGPVCVRAQTAAHFRVRRPRRSGKPARRHAEVRLV